MTMHTSTEQSDPKFPQATEVVIDLSGPSGNAFVILGETRRSLRDAGATPAQIQQYLDAATDSDYDTLIEVTREWVPVNA